MLPKQIRLNGKDVKQTLREKDAQRDSERVRSVIKKRNDAKTKFAILVTTKISKKAVTRNKIKRKIKKAVLEIRQTIKPGYNIIFIAKQQAVKAKTDQLKAEIKKNLKTQNLTTNKEEE